MSSNTKTEVARPTGRVGGLGGLGADKLSDQKYQLSRNELERVTEVFKMYETGLREATIYPKVRNGNIIPTNACKFLHLILKLFLRSPIV